MAKFFEVNFDGIPGPYHNYGGLAFGNVASKNNTGNVSKPREAALQALAKAKSLHDMGLVQGIIPPQPRPDLGILRSKGYRGSEAEILEKLRTKPEDLVKVYSSAAMWTANAATIAPSPDNIHGRINFVPANLVTNQHRAIEARQTYHILQRIFSSQKDFFVSPPLYPVPELADEGAANHMRLCPSHGEKGLHIFVYGSAIGAPAPEKYPARQTLKASETVAANLNLPPEQTIFIQQKPQTIDAGVFHNDVIAVSNENILLYHEEAFASANAVDEIRAAYNKLHPGKEIIAIEVKSADLSVDTAVRTYFFNSQIVTLPDHSMVIIAPQEAAINPEASRMMDAIVADANNPITQVHYKDLRQSMQNGGGPACLRLRVVMDESQIEAVKSSCNVILNEQLYERLVSWVNKNYREELKPADLFDISLHNETIAALDELSDIIQIPIIESQRGRNV